MSINMEYCSRCNQPGATVLVPQKGGDRFVHETMKDCEMAKFEAAFKNLQKAL